MLEAGEEVQTSAMSRSSRTLLVSAALGVPYAHLSNDMLKAI